MGIVLILWSRKGRFPLGSILWVFPCCFPSYPPFGVFFFWQAVVRVPSCPSFFTFYSPPFDSQEGH